MKNGPVLAPLPPDASTAVKLIFATPLGRPFVIGPEKQFHSYEAYLKSAEGASTVLHRLFPRDYWQPAR